jgi:ATP-dependent DNA helicase RecG
LEALRRDHASIPNNPLVAEALYLTRYIERVGSGTQTMIELCREAGLPEPDFQLRQGFFVATPWRDWLTTEVLTELDLNERQLKAITYLKTHGLITNSGYQSEFQASKRTASRDLEEMLSKGILRKFGTTGKGVHYRLGKGATKGP